MNEQRSFQPDWASPPGDTILDLLDERRLSPEQFARQIGHTLESVYKLLHGREAVTKEVAYSLEKTFGAPAIFWLTREQQYREDLARVSSSINIEEGIAWLKEIPIKDMTKFGWIPDLPSAFGRVTELLNYFGVSSIQVWEKNYKDVIQTSAFRTSHKYVANAGAVAAWLRQGEIEGNLINCSPWNSAKFENTLFEIRKLTRKKDPSIFLGKLKELCSDCGVAVVIVRAPSGCPCSGATRFVSDKKAIIQLSFRYLSDDQFWFTFFHEAGHLILHGKNKLFLENDYFSSKEEEEASKFAAQVLIPKEYIDSLSTLGSDAKRVMRFARDIDVSAGVVVGQLQHLGLIPQNYLNNLKARFAWERGKD